MAKIGDSAPALVSALQLAIALDPKSAGQTTA